MKSIHVTSAALLLAATSLAGHAHAQFNLRVDTFSLSTTRLLEPGQRVSFTATIHNNKLPTVRSTNWAVFLSTDSTISAGDSLRVSGTERNIPLGQRRQVTGSFTIPNSWKSGTTHAGFFVDYENRIRETNESDNTRSVTIATRAVPDLRIESSRILTSQPKAGQNIEVEVKVVNIGNGGAGNLLKPLRVGIFVGGVIFRRTSDILIGESTISVGPTFGRVTTTIKGRLPSSFRGKVFVHSMVDCRLAYTEQSEANNTAVSPMTIEPRQHKAFATLEWLPRIDSIASSTQQAAARSTQGGAGDMVLFSPGTPNGRYLCVWSCTRSLAFDACTDLSLALLNGPIMPAWFGQLDAEGLARPRLVLPVIPRTTLKVYTHALAQPVSKNFIHSSITPIELRISNL